MIKDVSLKCLEKGGVNYTRKMVPLQGERGHSSYFYFWSFQKQNREEGVIE